MEGVVVRGGSPDGLGAVVEAATDAAAAHEEAVDQTVNTSRRQHAAIERLREATRGAAAAAEGVATHAAELTLVAQQLPHELASTRAALTTLEGSLRTVAASIENGRGVTQRLDAGWRGVAEAVDEIARAARRARVLSVNASIEAAYVEAERAGFGIVADRMRALSGTTLDSARDVRDIVAATRESAAGVLGATDAAVASCGTVANALGAAASQFEDAALRGAGFTDTVARIAALGAEQGTASAQIAGSVERLAAHAARAATAAQGSATGISDGVTRARRAVAAGGAPALADVVLGLTETALAAARGGAAWRGVDDAHEALAVEFAQVVSALEELAQAGRLQGDAAAAVAASLAQLDRVLQAAADAFAGADAQVRAAHARGRDVRGGIVAMHAATDRAGAIVDAVSEIGAESGLLAINAAIEAARAGERGLGFTVIAEEIGRLARATRASAEEIATTIGKLRERGERFERASVEGSTQMDVVVDDAARGRAAVEVLRETVARSTERSRWLGESARALSDGADAILDELAAANEALGAIGRGARERARLTLSDLLRDAHHIGEQHGLDSPIARWHRLLDALALEVEDVYAGAVAAGRMGAADMHGAAYVELRGGELAHLGRLVDVRSAPSGGFTPPKYRTAYDGAVDLAVMAILDRTMAADARIASMGAFDLNGFAVALPSKASTTTDWTNNRAKRIFEDPIMLRMARVGLGAGAEGSGLRRTWAAFDRDGFALRRVTQRPWAPLAYLQDTGAAFVNIGTALYVDDVRVGTLSLIVDAERALHG